jgi:hypothetical protein
MTSTLAAPVPQPVRPTPRAARLAGVVLALAAFASAPATAASIHMDFDTDGGELRTDGEAVVIETDDGEARITPAGALAVDGRRVQVGERAQRDLVRYNALVHSLEDTAMEMGLEGVGLAAFAVAEAFGAVITGDENRAERRVEGRAEELKEAARELCDDMRRLERIQNRLASDLPAFRPFAVVELDGDDCVVED